jgi:uncharacterized membrane protein YedE/YeeE
MAKRMMIRGMTTSHWIVAWMMMAGLVLALIQSGQASALPTHVV